MSELLSPLAADIIGLIGSGLMVIAYAYSNMTAKMNFLFFNLLNLIGSLMLIASLTVHFNIASMAMEIVWAVIAVFGLIKVLRGAKA
ncbi:MAG: CBU_0592 family membrane protein [Sphingobium sp.]